MAWIYLLIAGLMEIGWAIGLKYTNGWTKLWPSVATMATMIVSFFFLSLSLKSIPMGTAYAVWTGIGAAGTAVMGIILFAEPRHFARLACIGLIVVGIIGVKMTSPQ